jgi:hypothetical protein
MKLRTAQEWQTDGWLNTDHLLSVADLVGKVIVVYAFQMLCPGCIHTSLPQAQRVHEIFAGNDCAIVGLHTVFEHHDAMRRPSLEAFVHEFRYKFPIGIDRAGADGMPLTMASYGMQGTPTIILIDRKGSIRKQKFGHEHDLVLGAEIQALLMEKE